jgi:hypothetical protein
MAASMGRIGVGRILVSRSGVTKFHSRRIGVCFLWRCVRMGMWRTPWVRRLVYLTIAGRVPVVRRRWMREPGEIMRAAAIARDKNDCGTA